MRFSFITLMGLTAWAKIPHDELQACEDCLTNSPGTQCQANPGGICYDLNPETGHCPPGTTPCIGVLETGSSCRDTGRDVIDQGCNETHPICVHANGGEAVSGSEGDHCAYCINTVEPNNENQVPPDEGCDEIHRVCVGDQQLAANVEGTACAVCFNSFPHDFDPNALDDGCPPTAPFCVNDDGDSPELWTPGTVCVANCFDTSVSDADEGVSCCVLFGCVRWRFRIIYCLSPFDCCFFYTSAPDVTRFAHWKMDPIQEPATLECSVLCALQHLATMKILVQTTSVIRKQAVPTKTMVPVMMLFRKPRRVRILRIGHVCLP